MDRVTTGVPGLDGAMGGGLLKGSTVLIAGPPGAGKSMLANQVAFHRIAQGGATLILTTAAGGVTKLVASLEGLEYHRPDVVGSQLQVHSVNALLAKGGLDDLLEVARRFVREHGVELVVLDAVGPLHTAIGDRVAVRRFMASLGTALFLLGCTTIMVMSQYGVEDSLEEQCLADAVILMDMRADGPCEQRMLRIPKMVGSAHLSGWHPCEVSAAGVILRQEG